MRNPEAQSSFRKRLLTRVGMIVGIALLLVVGITWMGAIFWLRLDAQRFVKDEADEISSFVIRADGQIAMDAYPWNEPHHLFDERRIDPLFVQVMDRNGKELFATENVALFPEGAYPRTMVDPPAKSRFSISDLNVQFVGGARLYFTAFPLQTMDRQVIGYVQIARFVPDFEQTVRMVGIWTLVMATLLLVGLLLLINVSVSRLLAPLQSIARTTDALSAEHLDIRVPVMEGADRESLSLAIAINRLLDRLYASFEDMKRFTANASHQLQTPLTVVKGHIDVALRRDREVKDYQKTLRLVGDEVDGMIGMVRSLLQLSRLEQNPSEISGAPVDLSQVCTQLIKRMNVGPGRVHLEIEDDVWIRSQEDLTGELIRILVDNALKYAPNDAIQFRVFRDGEKATVWIRDEGIGIAPADLPLVKERFFRGKTARDHGIAGEGLGLALAERLALWHGADLAIESGEGKKGTTVKVKFPLLKTG